MPPQEPTFERLVTAFENAAAEVSQFGMSPVHQPEYHPENGVITLGSVERFKAALAAYAAHSQAQDAAEQALTEAKANLDAWFPSPVVASLEEGMPLVAPVAHGVLVLVKHQGAYLIERGTSQEEALNKI